MLTCIYHPIHPMQVMEEEEAYNLKASGLWFDSPLKAKQYREKVEDKIKQESEAVKPKTKLRR